MSKRGDLYQGDRKRGDLQAVCKIAAPIFIPTLHLAFFQQTIISIDSFSLNQA